MARVYNFNPGPAAMPQSVLERAQAELLGATGDGVSVMNISHRSKEFQAIADGAEAGIRSLLAVPEQYAILFLQGSASLQFAMIPMNLRRPGRSADYVDTGRFSGKALAEAQVTGAANVVWSGSDCNYMRVPKLQELELDPAAEYVHICSNETVSGIRWNCFPNEGAPLIADMSSEILSRAIDVSRFGLIYAGAQKNLGPSGMALVIIRKDLAERTPANTPIFLRYSTHMAEGSLYNTPNTWAIYMLNLTCEWLKSKGGLQGIQKINEEKAALLYATIDSSAFWTAPAERESRSITNVVWRLANQSLEARFLEEAQAAGMVGLKGHRAVGGMRASIYNAVSLEAVKTLVAFMREFERKNG